MSADMMLFLVDTRVRGKLMYSAFDVNRKPPA